MAGKPHFVVPLAATHMARAMALIESIYEQEEREHVIFALCTDDASFDALGPLRMPQLRPLRLSALRERGAHGLPCVLTALFDEHPEIDHLSYIAPEHFLFGPPRVITSRSDAVTLVLGHDAPIAEPSFLVVRRSPEARMFLSRWRDALARQDTLDLRAQPEVNVITDAARAMNASRLERTDVTMSDGTILVGGEPLICVDFAELGTITSELVVPQLDVTKRLSLAALRYCVLPYATALARASAWVRAMSPKGEAEGNLPASVLAPRHTFIATRSLRATIAKRNLSHRLIEIDQAWDAYCSEQVICAEPGATSDESRRACPPPVPDTEPIASSRKDGSTPRVSALVSTYAGERHIRGCLEDLVAQTLFRRGELEIIVIDSASPENESTIVREFIARHSNIVLLRTDGREGVYMAWNRAARAARGRYLTNANTDDRHRYDALEKLALALDAEPEVALVYAGSLVTREANSTFHEAPLVGSFVMPSYDRHAALHRCFIGPHPMWRKSVHLDVGWFDARYRVAGDYDMWLRIAERHPIRRVDDVLGLYMARPDSVEHSNRELCGRESTAIRTLYLHRSGLPFDLPLTAEGFARDPHPDDLALQARVRDELARLAEEARASCEAPKPSFACTIVVDVPERLARALRVIGALAAATPEHIHYEVVFVERGVDEQVKELLAGLRGDTTIVSCAPVLDRIAGYCAAVRESHADVIVVVDGDATVTEGWLAPLLRRLELNAQAGLAVGRKVVMGAQQPEPDPFERIGAMAIRRAVFEPFAARTDSAPPARSYRDAAQLICCGVQERGFSVDQLPASSIVKSADSATRAQPLRCA